MVGHEVIVTEEPPGFQRVQASDKRPFYVSPVPRVVMNTVQKVEKYLESQHKIGLLLSVDTTMFSFRRRRENPVVVDGGLEEAAAGGGRQEVQGGGWQEPVAGGQRRGEPLSEGAAEGQQEEAVMSQIDFMVKQMSLEPGIKVSHKVELARTATSLESGFGGGTEASCNEENFKKLQAALLACSTCEEQMAVLYGNPEMNRLMCDVTHDICFEEIIAIDATCGVLSDFPPNVNTNFFAEIVKFGLDKAPRTVKFLYGFVVGRGEATRPTHVIKLASLFANLCHATNQNLSALMKLRALTMQLDNLTPNTFPTRKTRNLNQMVLTAAVQVSERPLFL
jgi:hypothetical protein